MRQIVIMPGGFHPFHAGHAALYKSAVEAFNNADTYVAATNDTKTRPFPFAIKEKLAKLAGVADKHFVQVKSPFQPKEITDQYNPEEDVLIFVRSEKDRNESPKPGGTKKDGTPAYFQPWTGKNLQPFGKQAYIAYLPTVEFGPGITSATEIRNAWPNLDDRRKTAMVMSLYPVTQKNPKLAANVVKMLDMGMGNELAEGWKQNLGAAALAGGMALGGLSSMGKTADTNWDKLPQQMSTQQDSKGGEKIMSITGPNNKGEYRVRVTTDNDVQEFITKTPPKTLNEFVPPSSDRGDSGDSRSRRIRKLLEIAIQVAKEKNIDELGMIHGMNMIAGDEFFNTAVEGILPDITDKEYMFVLQSAYKTVKQGLAEAKKKRKKKSKNRSLGRYFFPGYSYYGGGGESGESGGDGGGESVAEGLNEAVGGNYLYHATMPAGIMRILRSGIIKATDRPQSSTKSKTQYPTISTTRSKQYAESNDFVDFLNLTKDGNSVILVFDRTAVANHYKMFSTSQGTQTVGDEYEEVIVAPKGSMPIKGTLKGFYFNPRRTEEIEGYQDVPWFNELLNSPYYMGQKQGVAEGEEITEGPFVQRLGRPNKVNIYVRHTTGKPSLLIATDIPYSIYDKFIMKAMQKYPQFRQTDFSFKSADKLKEETKLSESVDYLEEK